MEIQVPRPRVNARLLKVRTEYVERNGEPVARDWVEYCATGQAAFAVTSALASHARKNAALWDAIGPAYEAWKTGQEIPQDGTPLAAWPGCTEQQAEILRGLGLRTVEEVAAMNDTMIGRVRFPNARMMRDMANRFLAAKDTKSFEQELAKRDAELAKMQAQLEQMADLVAASSMRAPEASGEPEIDDEIEGEVIPLSAPRKRGRPFKNPPEA